MTWKKARLIPADEVFCLCHLPVISLVRLRLLFQDLKGLPVQFQSFENRRNHGTRLKVPLFRCGAGSDPREATLACNKILMFQDLAFLRQLSRNKIPGDTPGIYLIVIYFRDLKNFA